MTAVADALDYAHGRGLLHRDVKPANIVIAKDAQRILLADFGIARRRHDVSGLTATNFTVGTMAYAAPEQLMGQDLDGRADQYALAATAYHLLTGSHLFSHSNPAVVIGNRRSPRHHPDWRRNGRTWLPWTRCCRGRWPKNPRNASQALVPSPQLSRRLVPA